MQADSTSYPQDVAYQLNHGVALGLGKRFPLGILFVHGIGEQQRGGTLTTFADPLYRFLARFLTGDEQAEREERKLLTQYRLQFNNTNKKNSDQRCALSNEIGVLAARHGDYKTAHKQFRKSINNDAATDKPVPEYNLGLLLDWQGDYDDARASYERAIGSGHSEAAPRAAYNLALLHTHQGAGDDARRAYKEAMDSNHRWIKPQAAINLGALEAKQRNFHDASECYRIATTIGDSTRAAVAYYNLGLLLANQDDSRDARVAYHRAIESDHLEAASRAAHNLSLLLIRVSAHDDARSVLERLVNSGHPDAGPKAAASLGFLLSMCGETEHGKAAYQFAIDSGHPEAAPTAAYNLALLLASQGDVDQAQATYDRAVALGVANASPLVIPKLDVLIGRATPANWLALSDEPEICFGQAGPLSLAGNELADQSGTAAVTLHDTSLQSPSADGTAPAHLTLEVEFSHQRREPDAATQAKTTTTTWCLAESWWAQEFGVPSFRVMVRWALTVAPPIIFEQYAKPFRRRWRFKKRKGVRRLLNLPIFVVRLPVELTRLVATAIMSAVAVLVLLLLLLLGILPIPKASGIVARLGSKLAGSLGDSYVLLESPAQFDAMITRVSRDLEWLAARCHKVVVVAHSQGAVIAHRALRRHRPRNVELFITLGAGLSKLVHIGTVRGRPKELRSFLVGASWMSTGLLLFFTVLGLLRLVLTGSVRELADVLLLVFGINSVYILLLPLIAGFTSRESVEHDLRQQLKLSGLTPGAAGFRWLDVHATADPVPNGPIFETGCQWIEDHEVRNWSSALNDHSGYVRNPDGFLGPLALRLGRLADDIVGQRLSGAYQEQILSASRRRRRRVGMLVAARWALLVAGIFATVRFWHDLRARANDVIVATPSWIKDPIKKLATSIQDFLEESRLEGPLRRMGLHLESTDEVVVAACLAIAAGLLAYTLVYLTWNAWEQRDVRRFIRGEPFDLGGFRSTTFVVTTLLVFVPAMVAGFAGTWDHPKDRSSVMDVVGRVGDILARLPLTSLMFVSFILLMIAFVGYVRMYDKGRFEEASRVVLWGFFVWLTSIVFVTPLGLLMPSWWDFPWLFISIPVTILSAVAVVRVLRRQGEAIREWLIQRSIQ